MLSLSLLHHEVPLPVYPSSQLETRISLETDDSRHQPTFSVGLLGSHCPLSSYCRGLCEPEPSPAWRGRGLASLQRRLESLSRLANR